MHSTTDAEVQVDAALEKKMHSTTDAFLFEKKSWLTLAVCILVKLVQVGLIYVLFTKKFNEESSKVDNEFIRLVTTIFVYVYVWIKITDDFRDLKMRNEKVDLSVYFFLLFWWFLIKYMLLYAVFVVMQNSNDNADRIENSLSLSLVLEIDNTIANYMNIEIQDAKYSIADSLKHLDSTIAVIDFILVFCAFYKNYIMVFSVNYVIVLVIVFTAIVLEKKK